MPEIIGQTLLGFDFGMKRIGVAIGQTLTSTSRALATVKNRNGLIDWPHIDRLFAEWQPDNCVLGLPLNLDGSEHDFSKQCRAFGRKLANRYATQVTLIDERLSSAAAETSQYLKKPAARAQYGLDALAAAEILQSYLNQLQTSNTSL